MVYPYKTVPVFLFTLIFIVVQTFLVLFVSPIYATEDNHEEWNILLDPVSEAKSETGVVVMPLPFSNPTIGTGLGAAVMYLYPVGENAPPSFTALGGLYTDTDTWGIGITQKTYLNNDKYRVNGTLVYYDAKVKFFGVGNDPGSSGNSIQLNQVGYVFVPEVLMDIGGHFLVGPRYRLLQMDTSSPDPPSSVVPPDETDQIITSSGLGLVIDYDSRDNQFYPYGGAFFDFVSMFNDDSLGSDLDYQTYMVNYNIYSDIGEDLILAFQVAGCATGGDVPYYDLCLFGSKNILRGYVGGQYRDKTMLATQAEFRWKFYEKWGAVGFAGVGEVQPSIGDYNTDDLLPSYGAGLRFMASADHRVNLSIDYARGKDSDAWYFRIGEAF